jgi:hypothetical protein
LVSTAEQISPAILSLTYGVTGMAMYRVKLLAAALLLTGGLATTIGSGWLTTVTAQQANTNSDAKPPAAKAPTANQTLREAALNAIKPVSKWEYEFVVASEMGTVKAVQLLHDQEAMGWEFNGQVTLQHEGKATQMWMFRRPAGQGKTTLSAPTFDSGLTTIYRRHGIFRNGELVIPEQAPKTLTTYHDRNYQPTAAERAVNLEAQIRALQAELTRLREQNKKSLTLPAEVVGVNAVDLVGLLSKLAARRFGESARKRLQLTAMAQGLNLTGDAEAVDWAADIVKRITGK